MKERKNKEEKGKGRNTKSQDHLIVSTICNRHHLYDSNEFPSSNTRVRFSLFQTARMVSLVETRTHGLRAGRKAGDQVRSRCDMRYVSDEGRGKWNISSFLFLSLSLKHEGMEMTTPRMNGSEL